MNDSNLVVVATAVLLFCGSSACGGDEPTQAGDVGTGFSDGKGGDAQCDPDVSGEFACNGRDDDCDGSTDEGLDRECELQSGVCEGASVACSAGDFPVCGKEQYGANYTKDEGKGLCDGLDNDCDGDVDEKCDCSPGETQECYPADPGTKGEADCEAGKQTCESSGTWGACRGAVTPEDEKCNGKDDDCDGITDPSCPCAYRDKMAGVCKGRTRKSDGTCPKPPKYESDTDSESACDMQDNDCDGAVDEGCTCDFKGRPRGVCNDLSREPDGSCPEPSEWESTGVVEVKCDGKDNDCDGATDEGCKCNYKSRAKGVCRNRIRTVQGTCPEPPNWEPATGSELHCDGRDNDCDGATDEGCSCDYNSTSVGVCKGQTRDSSGNCKKPTSWESATDSESTCKGDDNDCDGAIDEGCTCNYRGFAKGVCTSATRDAQGTCTAPSNYQWFTNHEPCKGNDNDCDGTTDEGCSCAYRTKSKGVCTNQTIQPDGSCSKPTNWEPATKTESGCEGKDNDCDGTTDEGCP